MSVSQNLNDELKVRYGSRGGGRYGKYFDAGLNSAREAFERVVLAQARNAHIEAEEIFLRCSVKMKFSEEDKSRLDKFLGARDVLLKLLGEQRLPEFSLAPGQQDINAKLEDLK